MDNKKKIAGVLLFTFCASFVPAPVFSQAAPPQGVYAPLGPVLFQDAPPAAVAPIPELGGGAAGGVGGTQGQGSTSNAAPGTRAPVGSTNPLDYAVATVAVIEDYILGPGDRFGVHIIVGDNALNLDYHFVVSLNGTIFFPAVGEVQTAGHSFGSFKKKLRREIQKKFKEQFNLSVILDGVRQIQVHVFGYSAYSGPMVVSALSTVTDVMRGAGSGPGGSGRFVILKRRGEPDRRIDLYAYFKKGVTAENIQLQSQDELYIPPVGDEDTIQGQVYRPGTYEIAPGEAVGDLIKYAGGLTKYAIWEEAVLLNRDRERKAAKVTEDIVLSDRDLLYIPGRNIKVQIIGEVEKPGMYDLYSGQTIRDLIKVAGGLKKSGALQEVVYLTRKLGQDKFEDRKLNVYKLMYEGDESQNIALEDGDIVTIPSIELFVYVYGEVSSPGRLPYIPGQKLSDYINNAGGPNEKSNLSAVSVSRSEEGRSRVFRVNASDILHRGQKYKDIDLRGGDVVFVPGRFFYFSDFNSLANLILTAGTLYGVFVRR